MSYLFKLVLALGMGLIAGAMNWFYVALQTQPTKFVAMAKSVEIGKVLEESDLVSIPVPGDSGRLRKSLIPYANRSILFGRNAVRDYEAGDLLFAQDLVSETNASQWDVIGPFELISVGERFKQSAGRETQMNGSTRSDTVTIAVNSNFDEQTSRLLQVIAGDLGRKQDQDTLEIIAVQVVPSDRERASSGRAIPPPGNSANLRSFTGGRLSPTAQHDTVYQTVSLHGIASVPVVLLEGDFIRFVVPKSNYSF